MNRGLLARVRDRIAEVGNEHCHMDSYAQGEVLGAGELKCGTTACIAGITFAVAYGEFAQPEDTEHGLSYLGYEAGQLLGLPGTQLFYMSSWPRPYWDIAQDEGHAKGMLAVIDALLDGSLSFDVCGRFIDASESGAEVGGRDE